MKKYLEFQDGTSYKFWQVEVNGASQTVTYGKIGTDGLSKTKEFNSEEEAQKDAEKLMKSKIRKGYMEKDEMSGKKTVRKFSLSYDEGENGVTILSKLEKILKDPIAGELNSIVIGAWEDPWDTDCDSVIEFFVKHKSSFPKVKEFFIGDMDYEECEISWILQGNYSELLKAYPDLETLHIKGSQGLSLGVINHNSLKKLKIECGGLESDVIKDIANSTMPALEHLELYLGVEDYGFDGSIKDLMPLLEKGKFPKLKYLGLRDSEIADEIAAAIKDASILDQIEILDLSLGTLSDKGAEELLASSKIKSLKKLDCHYHFISDEMMKKMKKMDITVDVSGRSDEYDEEDDEYRYPAVTE